MVGAGGGGRLRVRILGRVELVPPVAAVEVGAPWKQKKGGWGEGFVRVSQINKIRVKKTRGYQIKSTQQGLSIIKRRNGREVKGASSNQQKQQTTKIRLQMRS